MSTPNKKVNFKPTPDSPKSGVDEKESLENPPPSKKMKNTELKDLVNNGDDMVNTSSEKEMHFQLV